MNFSTDSSYAKWLDEQDELSHYRERFVINDPDTIYLDGNSLGRLPVKTLEIMQNAVSHQWGERLIRSWNESWIDTPRALGDRIAQLIGAQPGEVLVTDSTSVNLFKLVCASLRARPGRPKIISDTLNFPSDLYIFQGIIDFKINGTVPLPGQPVFNPAVKIRPGQRLITDKQKIISQDGLFAFFFFRVICQPVKDTGIIIQVFKVQII